MCPAAHSPIVTPMWPVQGLVCDRLTAVGGLAGFARPVLLGPWSGWLPGPALCGCCWPLVGRAGLQGHCGTLGGPTASAGSLEGRVQVQETPGPWSWCQTTGGWGRFLTQPAVGLLVSRSVC